MPKRYARLNWKDAPSTNTPRNARNFNVMDKGIDDLDNAIEDVQGQINNLVIQGDSSVEAAQARNTYPTLKARLDTENNEVKSQLRQKATKDLIHVDDYIPPTIDPSIIDVSFYIQNCFTDAQIGNYAVSFGSGKKYLVRNPINLSGNYSTVIYGNDSTLFYDITTQQDKACMYKTQLENVETSNDKYYVNTRTTIYNLNFMGNGYGIGYAHVVIGGLIVIGCTFTNLYKGMLLKGTNGIHILYSKFESNIKGLSCDLIAESNYGSNYVREGVGWNDGILLETCTLSSSKEESIGLYYGGSGNEAVVTLRNCIVALGNITSNSSLNGIYAKRFSVLSIETTWFEVMHSPGGTFIYTTEGGTINRNLRIIGCNFNSGQSVDCIVDSFAINTEISHCDFMTHLTNGNYAIRYRGAVNSLGWFYERLVITGASFTNNQILLACANHGLTVGKLVNVVYKGAKYWGRIAAANIVCAKYSDNSKIEGIGDLTSGSVVGVYPKGSNQYANTINIHDNTIPYGFISEEYFTKADNLSTNIIYDRNAFIN